MIRSLAALVLALASLVAGDVSVVLRPVVSVAGERATLGEVAELSGDPVLITVIRDLPVVELSDLGEHRLEADEVRRAVGHGLGSSLVVTGVSQVSRRGRIIAEADLIVAASATIVADGDDLTITTMRSSGALTVPDGGADLVLQAQALDNNRSGDIPFRIRVMRGEVEVARALVTLRVIRHREMTVAVRAIRRGERIGAGDLRTERVLVARTRTKSCTQSELIGREARFDLAEGTPLTDAVVSLPPAVRAGQEIVLLVTSERFQLIAKGQALNDGRMGETIGVRRGSDGRTVRGTIVADGQVRLEP